MRIRYNDIFTPEEMKTELFALMDDLAGLGVEQIAWANLYFTPLVESSPVELRTLAGEALSYLSVES